MDCGGVVFGGLGGKVDSSMFTWGLANITNCAKILSEALGVNT